jgi:hypothetical protein
MNDDQDTVLFELTISAKGNPQLRLVDPPSEQRSELVFTPLEERQPAMCHFVSEELMNWLRTGKRITLDDLQRLMASSTLPPNPSTISIINPSPS